MLPNQASLFDLDGTLLKVNSSFYFGKYLYQQGFFSFFRLLQLAGIYSFHKIGILSIESLHHLVFKRIFQGRSSKQVELLAEQFVEAHLASMLYFPAIERLKKVQTAGHFVAILSSSPNFIVNRIAQKLDVLNANSSLYAVDFDGIFSHIEHLVEGKAKAAWITKFRENHQTSIQTVSGYSDNAIDLPFLLSCDTKIVVNPCRKLKAISLQNGWEII